MINTDLKDQILQLETRQALEKKLLQEELQITYDSITPINLIKNTIRQVSESPEIKGNMVNMVVGLAAGYFSEKLFERISNNPFKRVMGSVVLFGITNLVSKNPEKVRSLGRSVFGLFRRVNNAG